MAAPTPASSRDQPVLSSPPPPSRGPPVPPSRDPPVLSFPPLPRHVVHLFPPSRGPPARRHVLRCGGGVAWRTPGLYHRAGPRGGGGGWWRPTPALRSLQPIPHPAALPCGHTVSPVTCGGPVGGGVPRGGRGSSPPSAAAGRGQRRGAGPAARRHCPGPIGGGGAPEPAEGGGARSRPRPPRPPELASPRPAHRAPPGSKMGGRGRGGLSHAHSSATPPCSYLAPPIRWPHP